MPRKPPHPHAKAQRHLSKTSEPFAGLIRRVGPCTLVPDSDSYGVLIRSVIAQQIATNAARSITAKLVAALDPEPLTPANFATLSPERLRACGLSAAKQRYLRALTDHCLADPDLLPGLGTMTDAEVTANLLPITGIGPWTVEMFLIFGLARPDVFPARDLGVQLAVRDLFGLAEAPKPKELVELAEPWRPYRTVATWYLWRGRGFVPQSGV